MLVEKLIFMSLAIYLSITIFFKFIKKLDKVYIVLLVMRTNRTYSRSNRIDI